MTDKTLLKNGIKKIFLDEALANKADQSKIEQQIDSFADKLSVVIDDYVRGELVKLKAALVSPGAYTATSNQDTTSGTTTVGVTAGTIQNYTP